MTAKYKDNKIWGGNAFGSVGGKQSPKLASIRDSLRLPPLSSMHSRKKSKKLNDYSPANIHSPN